MELLVGSEGDVRVVDLGFWIRRRVVRWMG
jgi:hypothetical protein